nr:MAG TPA: hypothetical protein [Bacteriophage sp.]
MFVTTSQVSIWRQSRTRNLPPYRKKPFGCTNRFLYPV